MVSRFFISLSDLLIMSSFSLIRPLPAEFKRRVKLPAVRAGLPGKVISLYIVPLNPACPVRAGRGTFRPI
jgi:hypothetical protein